MPRGPRRNLRPVAEHVAADPLDVDRHLADRLAGVEQDRMPAARATAPTASAGLTSPPLVGTWVMAISLTRSSIIASRSASTESWPGSSLG